MAAPERSVVAACWLLRAVTAVAGAASRMCCTAAVQGLQRVAVLRWPLSLGSSAGCSCKPTARRQQAAG
ncbi:hypothetical protein U9M48_041779 [Paspalum notatum var. saurae]|uniref:Uncharacterized protein n=1 Tax=Paspalum notatum var. saurae TaxID=547442 RepID=A0AAQ3URC3_PASNO